MAGFGRSKFGKGPFGKSDVGGSLIVESFPPEYLEDSAPQNTDPNNDKTNPLMQILKTYAASVSKRRDDIDNLQYILDYETTSEDILLLIGDMLGLGIDKNDPDFLKRSFVGNASQWLQIKSSKKGYQVRGLASGFTVSVDNFWRIDPSYVSLLPARHVYYLKPESADLAAEPIPHADVPPGAYVGTPLFEDETYAKSAYVRVVFEIAGDRRPGIDYNILLDLVIDKIKDVAAIHHELTAPQFLTRFELPEDVSTNWTIDESGTFVSNEFQHFDIIPADLVPLDQLIVKLSYVDAYPILLQTITTAMMNSETTNTLSVSGEPQVELTII